MSFYTATTARPDILAVSDLLDLATSGEYRIPRFQRPYVWSQEDMIQLFDSISKGYPIGSLLIWQTERSDISSSPFIGPVSIPTASPALKSYVVDGHQRLATLLGILRLPENYPRSKADEWKWWIAYDLKEEIFVHLKNSDPIPLTLLPLRGLLRTVDFARRTREIANDSSISPEEIVLYLDRADSLQRAIREYRIPIIVMKSGSLDDAVTIFARVNQRGKDMTPDQMVSALTFRDASDGDFDLSESIDGILGELRSSGFGDLGRRIVLQVILALASLDFTRPSYEKIVNRESYEDMRAATVRAEAALKNTVLFFAENIGFKTSRLLPYASIAVLLAIFFDTYSLKKRKSPQAIELLEKWFWATSFNGWFAGANTTDLRRAGDLMRKLGSNSRGTEEVFEKFFFSERLIRPFPESFDRRSARLRASILVQLIAGKPLNPLSSEPLDGNDIFEDESARDIPYFFPKLKRPNVSNPANRVILPSGFPRNARPVFLKIDDSSSNILKSHFISSAAFNDLLNEDFEGFISKREIAITKAEKKFLLKFELTLDNFASRNSEDFDSDI